jgi:hypothetical protein
VACFRLSGLCRENVTLGDLRIVIQYLGVMSLELSDEETAAQFSSNAAKDPAMERITPSLSSAYPPVKLYLDDLEEIEDIVQGSDQLYFELGEYRFDNINEVAERSSDQRFSRLIIWSFEPHLAIRVGEHTSLECYSFRDHTKASGIFYQLDRVLTKCARKPKFIYSKDHLHKMAASGKYWKMH